MIDTSAGPPLDSVLRRIRAWPLSSWSHGRRIPAARRAVQLLADLASRAEGRPSRPVPDAGVHAVADQLTVVLADARRAGVAPEDIAVVMGELSDALGFR